MSNQRMAAWGWLGELQRRQALCHNPHRPLLTGSMAFAAPSCLIQQHLLQLSTALMERCEQLQLTLSEQIEKLPLGNESWLQTERELTAAERALDRLHHDSHWAA